MLIGSPVTGLDLTAGGVVAVELSRGGVRRAVAYERSTDDAAALRAQLTQAGIATSRIHLVSWDAAHVHRTMVLPRMTPTERSLFLERELSRGDDGVARAFGAHLARKVSEGATTKDEILLAAGSREAVDRLLKPLVAARLTPRLLTTAPLALVAAAGALAPGPFVRSSMVVYYGVLGMTLAVVSDGILRLARQVPRLAVADVEVLELMTAEIQRSLRHYAQVAKGERVEQLHIGIAEGPVPRAELETRLDLPVVDLNEALEVRLLAGATSSPADAPGTFLLAFGAATLNPRQTPNLMPREFMEAAAVRRLRVGGLAAAAAVVVMAVTATAMAGRHAGALRSEVERLRRTADQVQAEIGEAGRIESERRRIRQWLGLLAGDPVRTSLLGDCLKEVSRVVPDQLRLERLSVGRGERGYEMKLAGTVALMDIAEAQAVFNRLYFGLRQSPLFHDVNFSLVKPTARPDANAPPPFPIAFEVILHPKDVRR